MKKLLTCLAFLHLQPLSANWHTIYAHGIVDGSAQAQRFLEAFSTPAHTALEFPDALPATDWYLNGCLYSITKKILGKSVNRSKMYMGQGEDIATLHNAVAALPQDAQIVLYGCSRGAATIINYLAKHNPANVCALVLDATPCDMPATIAPVLAQLGIHPKHAQTIFNTIFPAYPKDSITPIQAIKNISNKNLPILMLHAHTDQRVAMQNSYKLYQEFKHQGFTNVHLFILPEGKHSFLLQDEKMRPVYLKAVHNFYKTYGLPHDAQWIQQGFNFDQHQTDVQAVIEQFEQKIQNTYQTAIKRNAVIGATTICLILAAIIKKYELYKF